MSRYFMLCYIQRQAVVFSLESVPMPWDTHDIMLQQRELVRNWIKIGKRVIYI